MDHMLFNTFVCVMVEETCCYMFRYLHGNHSNVVLFALSLQPIWLYDIIIDTALSATRGKYPFNKSIYLSNLEGSTISCNKIQIMIWYNLSQLSMFFCRSLRGRCMPAFCMPEWNTALAIIQPISIRHEPHFQTILSAVYKIGRNRNMLIFI